MAQESKSSDTSYKVHIKGKKNPYSRYSESDNFCLDVDQSLDETYEGVHFRRNSIGPPSVRYLSEENGIKRCKQERLQPGSKKEFSTFTATLEAGDANEF
ncbi:uncharacterized protein I206_102907 [Kwoniella pini CBS 10737]|uniref:Uncharacterized protein n=1 Tax=Kwoniella pini CBS 10737 TaxID=1296096 RepID=A0A1B9I6Y1_9TREE|nr:uncharacterized protein I206_03257 [Kwoniella pini CBS 10737]OCF51191.1 hypothetical protein I206_03257 [Kwoniella pini CBS 10737]